jgi:uncharacterized membrane protein YhhN
MWQRTSTPLVRPMAGCRAGDATEFAVGFMAFLLVIFTALLLYTARKDTGAFSWALLVFCALVLGFMVEVNRRAL